MRTHEWFKHEMDSNGWTSCPEDETCDHCGRPAQYPMSLCCAHDIHDKHLLPVNDDGETEYPMPSLERALARVDCFNETLERIARGTCRVWGPDYERTCHDDRPASDWCNPCIAKAALDGEK